mgnify:CR=1 FL=1
MSRKNKKSRSKRGSRTQGQGNHRKNRHSGNKGGKGDAGSDKYHYLKVMKKNPRYFGKHGFKPPSLEENDEIINIGELDEYSEELLEEGLAEEDGDQIVIDVSKLGFDKVLGSGKVSKPLKVIAEGFSESAKEKIEDSGGTPVQGES